VVTAQHRGIVLGDARLLGQAHESCDDLVVDEVLRQVDVQVGQLEAEPLHTLGVVAEPGAQVGDQRRLQGGQFAPGGSGGGIDRGGHAPTLARERFRRHVHSLAKRPGGV